MAAPKLTPKVPGETTPTPSTKEPAPDLDVVDESHLTEFLGREFDVIVADLAALPMPDLVALEKAESFAANRPEVLAAIQVAIAAAYVPPTADGQPLTCGTAQVAQPSCLPTVDEAQEQANKTRRRVLTAAGWVIPQPIQGEGPKVR